jgi:hypothetical protein
MDEEQLAHFSELYPSLKEADAEEIWKHYAVIGHRPEPGLKISKKSPLIETYLLIRYLRKRDIPYTLWYQAPLFIHNETLYRITPQGVMRENLADTVIVTLRDSWRHPFFGILDQIAQQQGGRLAKPNRQTMQNTGCMNKFYSLRELYSQRDHYVGDVVIPYGLREGHHAAFVNFLKITLGPLVAFKFDCLQEGRGIVFRDLSKPECLPEVSPLLERHKRRSRELMITPVHRIDREFRCYFTGGPHHEIFSVKERVNKTPPERLVEKESIEIYRNLAVQWHEVKRDEPGFGAIINTAMELLSQLSYDTGCIEFAHTKEGKTVFFEVNPMAGPLPFAGEDLERTTAFYEAIFAMTLNLAESPSED